MTHDGKFNKLRAMRQVAIHPAPGVPIMGNWIVFGQINESVGNFLRYFVVFEQGPDEEKTRFFITVTGARSYYEHLIGSGKKPEQQRNTETWGCKSLEELKHLLEGKGRG